MENQTNTPEKKEAPKKASHDAKPVLGHTLDSKLKSLKSHAHSTPFNSGPHTEKHEDVLFDIKVLESLKRINS